jgi:hypothetical protein
MFPESPSKLMLIPPSYLFEESSIRAEGLEKDSICAKMFRPLQEDVISVTWLHHPNLFLYELAFAVSINTYHDLVQRVWLWFGRFHSRGLDIATTTTPDWSLGYAIAAAVAGSGLSMRTWRGIKNIWDLRKGRIYLRT